MRIHYLSTSPYVRKVVVAAMEIGLEDRMERIPADIRTPGDEFLTANPVGKVPALVRDDGRVLIDSPVICEFLDSLHDGHKLIPAEGDARWNALHLQAMADGVLDAAILYKNERSRPDGERSDAFAERQRLKMSLGLDWFESNPDVLGGSLDIGQIALACAIGWIEFRIGRDAWAEDRPGLAAWIARFSERPSMRATVPKDE